MTVAPEPCVECLVVPENSNLRDAKNNLLCADCAVRFYVQCTACSLFTAKDEISTNESAAGFHCQNCPPQQEAQLPFAVDKETVAHLVTEYLRLCAEEKAIKERLEAVKEQLKQVADAKSENGSTVTFEGAEGAIKCSYRTSLKAVPETVQALRQELDASLFDRLFVEKISFDVAKDFDKIVSNELPSELQQQLEDAVKRTESATLTVAKK